MNDYRINMTIDEAIQHCKEVSESCLSNDCSVHHIQLMNWLKELKELRKRFDKKEKRKLCRVTFNTSRELEEWVNENIDPDDITAINYNDFGIYLWYKTSE